MSYRSLVALVASLALISPAGASASAIPIKKLGFNPAVNGYSFPNYSSGGYQDLTRVQMQWLFGSAVCASGSGATCVLTPPAARWEQTWNGYMAAGHCEGLSITTLLFLSGLAKPDTFGASSVPQLALFGNPDLQSFIAYAYAFQGLPSVEKAAITGVRPYVILKRLITDLGKKQWSLHMYKPDGSGGHAVTPYAVDKLGAGLYAIRIYDNNFPDASRSVLVNVKRDTWSYQASVNPNQKTSLYQGDAKTQSLELWDIEPGVGTQPCPFCKGKGKSRAVGSQGTGSVTVTLSGQPQTLRRRHAHVLILDDHGGAIGYDGRGRFIHRMKGATVHRLVAGGIKPWLHDAEPLYNIPVGRRLRILLRGHRLKGHNRQRLSLIGPGSDVGIDNVNAHAGTGDAATVPAGLNGVTFHSNSPSPQSPDLHLGIDGDAHDYDFSVQTNDMHDGDNASIQLNQDNGTLDITPPAGQDNTVNIQVQRLNPDGTFDIFHHDGVDLGGDAAQLHYGTWQGTDTPITITTGGTDQVLGDVQGATDGDGGPPANNPVDTSTPKLSAGPSTLAFGKQDVGGGVSASQLFAVTNTGTKDVSLKSVDVTGTDAADFARLSGQTNDCTSSTVLIAGQACVVRLGFDPTVVGAKHATVTVTSNAPDVSVDLTGSGTKTELSSDVPSLSFANRDIDDGPTSTQTATLTNTGTETIVVTSVAIGGGAASYVHWITGADDCVSSLHLARGDTCRVQIAFDPSSTGAKPASVTVSSNAADVVVGLSGNGIQTELTSSAPSLAFGNLEVNGAPAPTQGVTITNTGTEPVSVTGLTMGGANPGDFVQQTGVGSDCSTSTVLAAGHACNLRFWFFSLFSAVGPKSATVTVSSNAPDVVVGLSGTGIRTALSSDTPTFAFGNQEIAGGATATQVATLTNTGTETVQVTSVTIGGSGASQFTPISAVNDCTPTLLVGPGSTCHVRIAFDPSNLGPQSATVTVHSNAADVVVGLGGTGILTQITAGPLSDFGSKDIDDGATAAQLVPITNTGTEPVHITGFSFGGNALDFARQSPADDCTTATVLTTGQTCHISLTFDPTAVGSRSLTLTVHSNAPDVGIGLTGYGIDLTAASPTLDFGQVDVSGGAVVLSDLVTNTGSAPVSIKVYAFGGPAVFTPLDGGPTDCHDLSLSGVTTLAPGASCTMRVAFDPTGVSSNVAALSLLDNSDHVILQVPVTGDGVVTSARETVCVGAGYTYGGPQFVVPTSGTTYDFLFSCGRGDNAPFNLTGLADALAYSTTYCPAPYHGRFVNEGWDGVTTPLPLTGWYFACTTT